MSVLATLAAWLEQLPALTQLAPEGVCTLASQSTAGAALQVLGAPVCETYVSGLQCQTWRCQLVVRMALPTEESRTRAWAACEALCRSISGALFPGAVPAASCLQSVQCGIFTQTTADDSGLLSFALPLEVQVLL